MKFLDFSQFSNWISTLWLDVSEVLQVFYDIEEHILAIFL